MTRKIALALAALCLVAGLRTAHAWDAAAEEKATAAVAEFKQTDPDIQIFFDKAYGYAVFPEITKGAVGIGGAHGEGTVVESGAVVGASTMTQVTIGLQLGGQTYRELIFFENKAALDAFKGGNLELSADASAVALKAGASKSADYNDGVAVFTMATGGLMFEASIGGQKFTYEPK